MKERLKFFCVAIISGILCSTVAVYATITYTASQVTYTKNNNQEVTLDSALDELYTNANSLSTQLETATNNYTSCQSNYSTSQSILSTCNTNLETCNNKVPTYYDIATGGKNNSSSASITASFTVSKQVAKGRYLVFVVNSSINGSGFTLQDYQSGSLSGCDSSKFVKGWVYSAYTDSSRYGTHVVNSYICTVNSTKTVTYTHNATNDDKNTTMAFYKL